MQAYEMRISDGSSYVCSSDLGPPGLTWLVLRCAAAGAAVSGAGWSGPGQPGPGGAGPGWSGQGIDGGAVEPGHLPAADAGGWKGGMAGAGGAHQKCSRNQLPTRPARPGGIGCGTGASRGAGKCGSAA